MLVSVPAGITLSGSPRNLSHSATLGSLSQPDQLMAVCFGLTQTYYVSDPAWVGR